MINLLILYKLKNKVLTMYGISKEIRASFSVLTTPSYGTIKPALNKLEKLKAVKTQKTMTSGGRPSTFYSITSEGEKLLKDLLLEQPQENPVQLLTSSRIKVVCAEVLNNDDKKAMFKILREKSETMLIEINNMLEEKNLDFYSKMVMDNLVCEYKNFIMLLEGLTRACNN